MLNEEQRSALKRARLNIQVTDDKLRYTMDWSLSDADAVSTLSQALVALHMAEAFITSVRNELTAAITARINEDE
jgi:hypothetical protein